MKIYISNKFSHVAYFFVLLFHIRLGSCIVLDSNKLSEWYPSYSTDISLYIVNRTIDSIETNTFNAVFKLKILVLSFNQLVTLNDPLLFASLTNLEYLDLGENKLNFLHSSLFKSLTKLRGLGLSFNRLISIQPQLFHSLTSLDYLFLDNNQLNSLDSSIFSRLVNLRDLRLNDNQLVLVDRFLLVGLTNLELVFVGANPISALLPSYALKLCSTNSKCTIFI